MRELLQTRNVLVSHPASCEAPVMKSLSILSRHPRRRRLMPTVDLELVIELSQAGSSDYRRSLSSLPAHT